MKKVLMVVVGFLTVFLADAASEFVEGDLWYYSTYSNEGKTYACITSGNLKYAGNLTIPSSLCGYSVKSIGNSAFSDCKWLESVVIPSSVSSIGSSAFSGCLNLGLVEIPSGVTSIGASAFYMCRKLESITIPSGVTCISDHAFGSSGLKSVEISSNVTSIEDGAFSSCAGLTSLVIPSSVTNIGEHAFYCCDGLKTVEIHEGVKRIGLGAFYGCGRLKSLTIPSSVTSVDAWAFSYCRGLSSVAISFGVTKIGSVAFLGCSGLTSVTIPSSVTNIGESAFDGCSGLLSVTIPSSVMDIGCDAFRQCYNLTTVYVSKGDVERIKWLMHASGINVELIQFVELEAHDEPLIGGDEGATVTGDAETGFVIKPSEKKTEVEVTIPQGVDAAKVTVEVSPSVASVKPNGAKVKIVSVGGDITEFLNVTAADGNGVVDLTKATVKEEIVKEVLDIEKGAVVDLCGGPLGTTGPTITTAPTRMGLFYQLREGETLGGMKDGDSTVGNGQPWTPTITVKGGNSAFYFIGVGKGE